MNLKTTFLAIAGVAVVSIVAVLIYFNFNKNRQENADNQNSVSIGMPAPGHEDVDEMLVSDSSEETQGASYVRYSPEVLENSTGRRVLFFYANWCPTCQPVDKELTEKANTLPEDLTVMRVNYNDTETDDNEEALAKKYNVTYQHTFVVIDENGELLKIWNGDGLSRILEEI